MQKTIVKLLIVQLGIGLVLVLLVLLTNYQQLALSIASGSLVGVLTTAVIWILMRRAPIVLRARVFYALMWICEIIKWLVVTILMAVFLKLRLDALGLVLGFSVTYVGGYWTMLKFK